MNRDNLFYYSSMIAILSLTILVITGYKRFIIWPQITDSYSSIIYKKNPELLCKTLKEQQIRIKERFLKLKKVNLTEKCDHKDYYSPQINADESQATYIDTLKSMSHIVRVSLAYPIIAMGTYFNINIHLIFSFLCILCIIGSSLLMGHLFAKHDIRFATSTYLIAFCLLSLFMNGRLILSNLSIALVLWLIYGLPKLSQSMQSWLLPATIFTSFTFSNVSSGINVMILSFFVFYMIAELRLKTFPLMTWFSIFLACCFQAIWVLAGITKNLVYYKTEDVPALLIKLLSHGIGQLTKNYFILALLIILGIGSLVIIYRYRFVLKTPLITGLIIFTLGGFFGFSVMSGTLIFIITIFLDQLVNKYPQSKLGLPLPNRSAS